MNVNALPKILTDSPNWVTWKYEIRNGKSTKVPYDAKQNGKQVFAKSNDPSTWSTFQQALDAVSVLSGNDYDGIGFMLKGTDFVGVDFDGVLTDGNPEPYVLEILRHLGNPYTEITPSGNGLRAFVQCSALPSGQRKFSSNKYGAEIYAGSEGGRYLTTTGNKFGNGDGVPKIENIELPYLLISQVKNEKFKKLWMGDPAAYGDGAQEADPSRADLSLLSLLKPLLNQDRQKIEAFFSASVLGHREKWTGREDYREMTLEKAGIVSNPSPSAQKPEYTRVGERSPEFGQTTKVKSGTADQITPKKIGWLWKNRFALKLNLIVGNPDQGKGLITYYLAACVTTNRGWIDGQPNDLLLRFKDQPWAPHDEVLIMSGEEDWSDTIVPRLMAAEANLEKVRWLKMEVTTGMSVAERELQLDRDAGELDRFLEKHPRIGLVIIDPLSSYLGKTKMIDEQTVRAEILMPLKEIADRRKVAVVGVMHLNKKVDLEAIHRTGGAVAFVGVARMVWLVAAKPTEGGMNGDERVMVKVKGNIVHRNLHGLTFVTQARCLKLSDGDEYVPFVNWVGQVDAQADQLGKPVRPAHRPAEQLPAAVNWLQRYLKSGAKLEAQIERDSQFSKSTLKRARAEIGVRAFQKNRQWRWELTIPEEAPEEGGNAF